MLIDRMSVLGLWQRAQIREAHVAELKVIASTLLRYKSILYDQVQAATGIPWYVVGAIDCREESFRHTCYLGNGDPLYRKTTHVPAGRGPFDSWYEGAIDALKARGFDRLPTGGHWDIVTALMKTDAWNGLAYDHMGLPSPYVWALTTVQQPGKYVADHVFDPNYMDTQAGTAAILLALKEFHQVDLNEA
jgi:lysozyme family protein